MTSKGLAWSYTMVYSSSEDCIQSNGKEFCELLRRISAEVYNREEDQHDRQPSEIFGLGWWNWKIRPTPEDDSEGKLDIICVYYKIKEGHACGFSD
ncbi:hypothetical protein [Leptospira kirschneri]|uniref:hypothetical protein n=1 Tax=Leptospira kirschneri TaxID=29507 RepID=UPI002117E25B|nr:hypothetical protein [Leptospira kirschneri]